jgi:hypothetical protein
VSQHFVSEFLASVLEWSVRKGTRAAQHIPVNAREVCEEATMRYVNVVAEHNIPADLIINMDQQGVTILIGNDRTYDKKGTKQVDIAARDERRAYTICVASTPAGTLLPFQQIWSGSTEGSLPVKSVRRSAEALGMHFTPAASKKQSSHFSTLKTMKEWMIDIAAPHIKRTITRLGLRPEQKSLLILDCYPVHTGAPFRSYMAEEFPNIFLMYIPANCMSSPPFTTSASHFSTGTGVFQPADVGLQRIIKHFMRQETISYLVSEHSQQLAHGLTPQQVKFATSIKPLRDATVGALERCFTWLASDSGRLIVQRAWSKCTFEGAPFSLSAEYLTSNLALSHLLSYLKSHHKLFDEISDKVGDIWGVEDMPDEGDDDTDGLGFEDDTDVPMRAVVRACLDLDIHDAPNPAAEFVVDIAGVVTDDTGDLVSAAPEEKVDQLEDAFEDSSESDSEGTDSD